MSIWISFQKLFFSTILLLPISCDFHINGIWVKLFYEKNSNFGLRRTHCAFHNDDSRARAQLSREDEEKTSLCGNPSLRTRLLLELSNLIQFAHFRALLARIIRETYHINQFHVRCRAHFHALFSSSMIDSILIHHQFIIFLRSRLVSSHKNRTKQAEDKSAILLLSSLSLLIYSQTII